MGPETIGQVFRAIFELASDAIVVVDGEGTIVLANPAIERLLGHGAGELIGRSVDELVPARFTAHAVVRARFAAAAVARPMGRGQILVARHRDGGEIPVDIALTPMTVEGVRYVAAALRDQRGRVVAPEALRVHATALRSAANGVVITDRAGTITWVNPAACAMTGYAADELIGQHTRILKSGEHAREFYAWLWRTILDGETFSGTMVNRRKDGSLYHEEQTIAPVIDDDGQVTHFIAIKQDVSARRRAEDALERAHISLAEHVAEIESLNRQLREQAIRDPLTGLYNRRYLDDAVGREVARAARAREPLAVAVLDVDHFKRVNDGHGHAAGDDVLRALADVLRAHVRISDLVCRIGGEEFVVVLPGMTAATAHERADEWRAAFAAAAGRLRADGALRCTVSIGVAEHQPPEDFGAALGRADAALYHAKRSGRDRVSAAAAT